MMLVVPPYICTRTLHQKATHGLHAQWQYDRGDADCKTLTLKPYETAIADSADEQSAQGNENKGARWNVRLAAEESMNVELLMETTRPVTLVVPQDEEEGLPIDPWRKLKAYAPMYTTLIDPPYELPPYVLMVIVVVVLQSELFTLLMETLTSLAVVNPDELLLLKLPMP
jgi:hypothetical protein